MGAKKHRYSASETCAYGGITTKRKIPRATGFEAANGCEAANTAQNGPGLRYYYAPIFFDALMPLLFVGAMGAHELAGPWAFDYRHGR
jgi:hypothetical protein